MQIKFFTFVLKKTLTSDHSDITVFLNYNETMMDTEI